MIDVLNFLHVGNDFFPMIFQDTSTKFDWSAPKQALVLGSYFWSYPFTSLFGGMAAERWGPRYVVFYCSIASGILTAISPIAASWSYIALVVVRLLLGFAGVCLFF